jgi:hypothetical protein
MTRKILLGMAAVILVISACACAVSASTVTLGSINLAGVGSPGGDIPITLDSAPAGIAGYSITVTIVNPSVAQIVGVKYPNWADSRFESSTPTTNGPTRNFRVVDVGDIINSTVPSSGIYLGSVTVQGLATSQSTDVTITVDMDSDDGSQVKPGIVNGKIGVALPPGSIQVTVTDKVTFAALSQAVVIVDQGTQPAWKTDATGTVTIDGLIPGSHGVTVKLDGYVTPPVQSVTVASGPPPAPVSFALTKTGNFRVFSRPVSGATISIGTDTASMAQVVPPTVSGGTLLTGYEPAPQTYIIRVEKPGYLPAQGSFQTSPASTKSVTLAMQTAGNEISGYISVDSDPRQARVILNGEDTGLDTPALLTVNPGEYSVTVQLENYETPEARGVTVESSGTETLFFYLQTPGGTSVPEFPAPVVPLVFGLGMCLLVIVLRTRRKI